jgi:hypothetical protein
MGGVTVGEGGVVGVAGGVASAHGPAYTSW